MDAIGRRVTVAEAVPGENYVNAHYLMRQVTCPGKSHELCKLCVCTSKLRGIHDIIVFGISAV